MSFTWFVVGAFVGGLVAYHRGWKEGFSSGFVTGWVARHQGQDGIPPQYSHDCSPSHPPYMLSHREKELLKDPDERPFRRLPPSEE